MTIRHWPDGHLYPAELIAEPMNPGPGMFPQSFPSFSNICNSGRKENSYCAKSCLETGVAVQWAWQGAGLLRVWSHPNNHIKFPQMIPHPLLWGSSLCMLIPDPGSCWKLPLEVRAFAVLRTKPLICLAGGLAFSHCHSHQELSGAEGEPEPSIFAHTAHKDPTPWRFYCRVNAHSSIVLRGIHNKNKK